MSSYEAVNLFVQDRGVPVAPLEAVVVRVFSEDGRIVYGQNTTDATGLAGFLLPAPATYQVRLYRFATAIKNPNYIEVLEAPVSPATNDFTLEAEPFHHPQATDPRLCLASGFFRTPSGSKGRNVDMHFIAKFDPVLLDGAAVLTERVLARSDADGYAELSLIRFAQYDVTVEGIENFYRSVCVPDQPWVNLPDLLFPRVKVVEFSPVVTAATITLDVGDEVTYDIRVGATDRNWLPDITSDVMWSVDDPSVASITLTATSLSIQAVAVGSTTLKAVRKDLSIVTIPDTAIEGVPVTITVL